MTWFRALPIRARVLLAIVPILALGAGGLLIFMPRASAPLAPTASATPSPTLSASPTPTPSPTPIAARCPLNGLPLKAAVPKDRTALLVQIENNPLGRPTRNLTNADVVIEATVEGDVTRYSAVFYCEQTVGLTGPIRSARYYNVDLWQELHALAVAFGVAHGVQARFDRYGMPELNGLRGFPSFFRRAGSAPAPHNLYGDIEAVRAATTAGGSVQLLAQRAGTVRPPFVISPDANPTGGKAVSDVTIKTNGYWTFGWQWEAATGTWQRTEAGVPTSDAATGEPITATSVVVQRMAETILWGDNDPGGYPRRDLHLVGLGTGTLFVDGRAIPVTWSRPSPSAPTTWTYADGSAMVLPPGHIWWELVPTPATVTTS